MSTRIGSVTKPDGHVFLEIYASFGGVEITPHIIDVTAIDPVQAEAAAALLRVAAAEVRRMRREGLDP